MTPIIPSNINVLYIPYKKQTGRQNDVSRVEVFIKAGNSVETKDELGISHLLEHMIGEMFNKEPWISKGVIFNAKTNVNEIRYYIKGSTKVHDMIKCVYDMVTMPTFTEQILNKSKFAVKQELQGFCNDPIWLLNNKLYSLLSKDPGIYYAGDWALKLKLLDSFTVEILEKFHKKWYTPENMFFVIVSDKDCKECKEMGNVTVNTKTKQMKTIPIPQSTQSTPFKITRIKSDGIKSSNVVVTYVSEITDDTLLYTDIISKLFCGDVSSILLKKLRNELHLVYFITLTFERINNLLIANFDFSCEKDKVDVILKHFFDILYNYKTDKDLDKKIQIAKEKIYIELLEHCPNLEFLSFYYGQLYIFNNKIIDHEKVPGLIKNVSAEKIIKTVDHIINKKSMFVCVQDPE